MICTNADAIPLPLCSVTVPPSEYVTGVEGVGVAGGAGVVGVSFPLHADRQRHNAMSAVTRCSLIDRRMGLNIVEGHQLPALFIPQVQSKAADAARDAQPRHLQKCCTGVVTFAQPVIRNARAQVVNVMKANVAGTPVQKQWQIVEGTTSETR